MRTRLEIAQLHQRLGTTMIFVTHDQVEAMTLADRIVVLNQGGIEQVGSPMDIYLTPRTEFVASFVGSPKINLLPVTVDPAGDRARARLPNGAIIDTAVATADLPTGALTLGLRPECIRPAALHGARSEERRVGKEGVSTGKSWG